ncbi:MAG: hypothetical protein PVS3B2_17840 [Candidatus Dormibacteraceae bacterium]
MEEPMKIIKLSVGLGMAALAMLALSVVQAFACTSLATLNLSESSGPAGSEIIATGSSFSSVDSGSSAVAIHWNGVDGPILAQVTPDASGAISAKFKVPANLEPGYYIITATQTEKSGAPAWGTPAKIAFQVVGPGGAVTNPQGEAQGVAQSPANSGFGAGAGTLGLLAGLGVLGLLLFVLGTASFIGSYRKSPAVSTVRKR